MTKKILTFIIAVTMIFSLFAFSVTAVDNGIGVRIESDAVVGMPVGSTVTVKYYYTAPDTLDLTTYKHSLSTTIIAFNSEYYTYVANSRTFGAHYASFLKAGSVVNPGSAAFWNNTVSPKLTAADIAKGYTYAIMVNQSYEVGGPYTATTGYPIVTDEEVFSVQFTVAKTLTADAVIGIPEGTIPTLTAIKYLTGTSSSTYTAAELNKTEMDYVSTHVNANFATNTKIRRNTGNSALVDLGFTGSFLNAGIPIAFTGGRSTNVTAVGVELTINGVTNTYEDNFVYLNANSNGYLFRVALTGIPDTEYDTPIKARMFVTYNGVDYWSDYVTTTAGAHVGRLP